MRLCMRGLCLAPRSAGPTRAKMGACFEEGVRMRDDGAIGVNTCSPGASCDAAGVLSCIEARSSTRRFDADVDITQGQRDAVLHAASRAPSAGAMMMYSIIDIREQATRDRLAVLCDNQPMIAKAPWALVFVVDYCKWIDLFEYAGCLDRCVLVGGRMRSPLPSGSGRFCHRRPGRRDCRTERGHRRRGCWAGHVLYRRCRRER